MKARDEDVLKEEAEHASCPPIALLLARLGRRASEFFREALKPTELRQRHFATLRELRDGPLTQQRLGEAIGVDPTQLVGFLNELESENLIRRRRDPADRRRHIVEMSELGCSRLASADDAIGSIDDRLMGALAPEDRARFIRALQQLATTAGPESEERERSNDADRSREA